jgi:7-cyano-7-deazaguanine reductase
MDAVTRSDEFVALGHAGSDHYAGLETFPNPGVSRVELTSDELVAVCPITGQPDMYNATIDYTPGDRCLESKSLKLYLSSFRNEGVFCEALAVKIRDDVAQALGLDAVGVRVSLTQKARGGITITAFSSPPLIAAMTSTRERASSGVSSPARSRSTYTLMCFRRTGPGSQSRSRRPGHCSSRRSIASPTVAASTSTRRVRPTKSGGSVVGRCRSAIGYAITATSTDEIEGR